MKWKAGDVLVSLSSNKMGRIIECWENKNGIIILVETGVGWHSFIEKMLEKYYRKATLREAFLYHVLGECYGLEGR